MSLRIVAASLFPLALLSCGVKTDLERPMMQIVQPQPQRIEAVGAIEVAKRLMQAGSATENDNSVASRQLQLVSASA